MKALTLTQPWATLVAIGAKRIETRGWRTEYRGQIAIHAAKGFPDDARYLVSEEPYQSALRAGMGRELVLATDLPTASIIAVANLLECFEFDERTESKIRHRSANGRLPRHEFEFGNYDVGRFGFVLENVVALEHPIVARGMLNLWNIPRAIEDEVLRGIPARGTS